MSDSVFPIKIEAPELTSGYGQNIENTFDNIDKNFNVLANQELYKGDAGQSLLSISIPWSTVFTSGVNIEIDGYEYKIINFKSDVVDAFTTLAESIGATTGANSDVTDAITGLKDSNWSVVVSFEEPVNPSTAVPVQTIVPFVFVDPRFRATPTTDLQGKTDLSCVITCNGTNNWECIQNFPTIYYSNDPDSNDPKLYWIINGNRTQIEASGPKGIDGQTGVVYVGLSENITSTPPQAADSINIQYLLNTNASVEENPDPDHELKWPFLSLGKWKEVTGEEISSGAPILVLPASTIFIPDPSVPGSDASFSPYYIASTVADNDSNPPTLSCVISEYNLCYAYMNDLTIKNTIKDNVKILPAGTDSVTGNQIAGYSIRERTTGNPQAGYSIFARENGLNRQLTISYVNNIDAPIENTISSKSKFRIAGALMEGGVTTKAIGNCSHAEGQSSIAIGDYSHAEGRITVNSISHVSGSGTTYTTNTFAHNLKVGDALHYSDIYTYVTSIVDDYNFIVHDSLGTLNDANVFVENGIAFGSNSHSEGQSISIGLSSHSEGQSISIGPLSHSEGYDTLSNGQASHSEGNLATSKGNYSHAEGYRTTSSGVSSHAEGDGVVRTILSTKFCPEANGSNVYRTVKWFTQLITPEVPGLSKGDIIEYNGNYAIVKDIKFGEYSPYYAGHLKVILSDSVGNIDGNWRVTNGDGTGGGYFNVANGVAVGSFSHAEGSSVAIGECSHAEGIDTLAIGDYSHAEGRSTIARGYASHAEGYFTEAVASYSHSSGFYTKTSNSYEQATGYYNETGYVWLGSDLKHAVIFPRNDYYSVRYNSTEYKYAGPIRFSVGDGNETYQSNSMFCCSVGSNFSNINTLTATGNGDRGTYYIQQTSSSSATPLTRNIYNVLPAGNV